MKPIMMILLCVGAVACTPPTMNRVEDEAIVNRLTGLQVLKGIEAQVVARGDIQNRSLAEVRVLRIVHSQDEWESLVRELSLVSDEKVAVDFSRSDLLAASVGQQAMGGSRLDLLSLEEAGDCLKPNIVNWRAEVGTAVINHPVLLLGIAKTQKQPCVAEVTVAPARLRHRLFPDAP